MVCDALGQSYFYRYIGKHLESIEVGVGDSFVTEAFLDWPLSELKADQFKQKNAKFFGHIGQSNAHFGLWCNNQRIILLIKMFHNTHQKNKNRSNKSLRIHLISISIDTARYDKTRR